MRERGPQGTVLSPLMGVAISHVAMEEEVGDVFVWSWARAQEWFPV